MITFTEIQNVICNGEKIPSESLKGRTRKHEIVLARQMIIYFLKKYTKESLLQMARHYGRDHSTAIHSIKTVNNFIDTDKNFARKINSYNQEIARKSDLIFHKHLREMKCGFPIVREPIMIYN